MIDETQALRALGALAHPLRLQVFRALVVVGPAGLTPGAITQGTGVPPATLSFHLRELAAAALVTQARNGRHLVYRAAFARMNALVAYLGENCCGGQPCEATSRAASCEPALAVSVC